MKLLPLLASFTFSLPLIAADWPMWRGADGSGITTETGLPNPIRIPEDVAWKVPLPEPGNSTPIIVGERVFLTQAVGARRTLMCFDRKDGKLLWQEGPTVEGVEATHKTNPYCAGSPAAADSRVVAWFGRAGLWCWDFAGKEAWHVDLGMQEHIWGYAASPVIDGDLCILNFGPGKRSFVVAVAMATGKEVWRFPVPEPAVVEGPGDPKKDFVGSWNTGVIRVSGGKKEYIISLPGAVWSLDPGTGKPLWHAGGLNPLAYAEPLIDGDTVIALGGFSGYSIGVRTGGTGDVTASNRLWQEKRNPQRIGSGVVHGGLAFITSEPGILQCIDPKTGKEMWKARLESPSGRSSSWSSLLLCGEFIYTLTQATDLIVFRASAEKYEQVSAVALKDGHTNSSLAPSDGQFFVRTNRHLWCIGSRTK